MFKNYIILGILLFLFNIQTSCKDKNEQNKKIEALASSTEEDSQNVNPGNKLISIDLHRLQRVDKAIKNGNETYNSIYNKIIQSADKALKDGVFSVVNKTQIPPSGDKHDYLSLGPYWWPDPKKKDGLPWIRKDGEINPKTRGEHVDQPRKNKFIKNTYDLVIAYYFSGEKKYADKAKELLTTWFLNPKTKMNPNLNFAQGIPGKNTGRGIGIIEFAGIKKIITSLELLKLKNQLDQETESEIKAWLTQYLDWLQHSEFGIFEKNTKNNHATAYDVQETTLLLYLNRAQEAKQVLESVKKNRIDKQIEDDGSQPHELERTKALSYSILNLGKLTELAFYGLLLDVDLFHYQSPEGASIVKAYEFLYPYALGEKKWDYQQITGRDKALEELRYLFIKAGSTFEIKKYCELEKLLLQKDNLNFLLNTCM